MTVSIQILVQILRFDRIYDKLIYIYIYIYLGIFFHQKGSCSRGTECVSVAVAGKEASDGRKEKIMLQDGKKRHNSARWNSAQLLTHTDTHIQVTPMMPLASCLKGVLREHVLTPTTIPYQRHLALSQPIRIAINHASRKHCHLCCSSSSPRLPKRTLDSGNVFSSPFAADILLLATANGPRPTALRWKH